MVAALVFVVAAIAAVVVYKPQTRTIPIAGDHLSRAAWVGVGGRPAA
jgi:hypothetical protein